MIETNWRFRSFRSSTSGYLLKSVTIGNELNKNTKNKKIRIPKMAITLKNCFFLSLNCSKQTNCGEKKKTKQSLLIETYTMFYGLI